MLSRKQHWLWVQNLG